ncbi:MAG TPA: hypothetical protein VMV76_06710 [Dehalococcoidia bacterium]|nr:hypothetical protein [Dehalococcoidia bacterium]
MAEEYETSYPKIEEFEAKNFEWHKSVFLKERLLFTEMIELILESFKPLSGRRKETDEGELAMATLATRMFNDAEGAKLLLLWGLPDQAQPLIRDVIECTMLFRLFLREPKMAKRWLMNLVEYHPKDANTNLRKLGVLAKEYAWYGLLSHQGHSNLLASLSHTQETDVGEQGMLREYHFGGARTPETEYLIQVGFLMLFSLLNIALNEPLAGLYYERSESDAFSRWSVKVGDLKPKLLELFSEITERPASGTSKVGDALWERTKKKLHLKDFERLLTELGDLPLEN